MRVSDNPLNPNVYLDRFVSMIENEVTDEKDIDRRDGFVVDAVCPNVIVIPDTFVAMIVLISDNNTDILK